MPSREDAILRSALIDERIRQRTDIALRNWLSQYRKELDYFPLDALMISEQAWQHVQGGGIEPRIGVCASSAVAGASTAIGVLPGHRAPVAEAGERTWRHPSLIGNSLTSDRGSARREASTFACLYNTVISSIIEGAADWTLENGYRNIIANMGIGLDGTIRNVIGQDAERDDQGPDRPVGSPASI